MITKPVLAPQPEAVALALPNAMPYEEWLEVGRDLASKRRSFDWMVGDWITFGREHFPEQIQEALPLTQSARVGVCIRGRFDERTDR